MLIIIGPNPLSPSIIIQNLLTLLASIHFVGYYLGELVETSRQFVSGDQFLNSHDLYVS